MKNKRKVNAGREDDNIMGTRLARRLLRTQFRNDI